MKDGQIIGRRQKLRRIEVLRDTHKGARTRDWFEGEVPANDPNREDKRQATRDLLEIGLLEKDDFYPGPGHPHPYRLTAKGLGFIEDVWKTIGEGGGVNWNRVPEIQFPT